MGYAIIAWDGPDPARRAAARDKHLSILTRWAQDGRLALGVPLFSPAWQPAGSLMVLNVPDKAGLDAYLAEEPFAVDGVWDRWEVYPYRIASLPYRPLPQPGEPVSATRTHTVTIALDGTDAGAAERRAAVRPTHLARVTSMAADGTLTMGGAVLDEAGAMRGSIVVTRHATDAEARAWIDADPYVTGRVWQDITMHGTRFAPLPYRPLPGTA